MNWRKVRTTKGLERLMSDIMASVDGDVMQLNTSQRNFVAAGEPGPIAAALEEYDVRYSSLEFAKQLRREAPMQLQAAMLAGILPTGGAYSIWNKMGRVDSEVVSYLDSMSDEELMSKHPLRRSPRRSTSTTSSTPTAAVETTTRGMVESTTAVTAEIEAFDRLVNLVADRVLEKLGRSL